MLRRARKEHVMPAVMTVFAMLMKLLLATLIRGLPQMAASRDSALHQQWLINSVVARRLPARAADISSPHLFCLHICVRYSGQNLT